MHLTKIFRSCKYNKFYKQNCENLIHDIVTFSNYTNCSIRGTFMHYDYSMCYESIFESEELKCIKNRIIYNPAQFAEFHNKYYKIDNVNNDIIITLSTDKIN